MQTVSALKKNKSQRFYWRAYTSACGNRFFPNNLVSFFRFSLKCSDSRLAYEKRMIPVGVDFEILIPVHSTLVKPTLAPGQVLNGVMVHRIFKEKTIYIQDRSKKFVMFAFPA